MANQYFSIPFQVSTEILKALSSPEAESRRLENLDWDEREGPGAQHLKERLSCVPFYAKRAAKKEAETGDPMAYWKDLWGCMPNIGLPLKESSTAES